MASKSKMMIAALAVAVVANLGAASPAEAGSNSGKATPAKVGDGWCC